MTPRMLLASVLLLTSMTWAWGETPTQVARRARSLLSSPSIYGVAILSSTYHDDYEPVWLRGMVSSGAEYFAPCYDNGDLLMLALPVSQNWRNALTSKGKNATLSITSNADPSVPDPRFHKPGHGASWDPDRPAWRRGMPSKQRLTLYGHIEVLTDKEDDETSELAKCFVEHHKDARHWTPGSGDSPHFAEWTRFHVDGVYRVGGFGDESSIGWIDLDDWRREGGHPEDEQLAPVQPLSRPGSASVQTLFAENGESAADTPPLRFQRPSL